MEKAKGKGEERDYQQKNGGENNKKKMQQKQKIVMKKAWRVKTKSSRKKQYFEEFLKFEYGFIDRFDECIGVTH